MFPHVGHAGLRKGTDLRSDKLCKLVSFGLESLESGAREESKHKTYKKGQKFTLRSHYVHITMGQMKR